MAVNKADELMDRCKKEFDDLIRNVWLYYDLNKAGLISPCRYQ